MHLLTVEYRLSRGKNDHTSELYAVIVKGHRTLHPPVKSARLFTWFAPERQVCQHRRSRTLYIAGIRILPEPRSRPLRMLLRQIPYLARCP